MKHIGWDTKLLDVTYTAGIGSIHQNRACLFMNANHRCDVRRPKRIGRDFWQNNTVKTHCRD